MLNLFNRTQRSKLTKKTAETEYNFNMQAQKFFLAFPQVPTDNFQARACNTQAFRAVARSATRRQRARRLAPWPRERPGARTATLPWRGGRGAGQGGPPPLPQRRWPAGVAQRLRAGPSPRRAAHLRKAGGAADTAHGWAGGIDRHAKGRP